MKILLIVAAVLGLFALAQWLFVKKAMRNPLPGELVDTHGRKLHIVELPSNGRTIVMLPGMGTDVPSADFLPFAKGLHRAGFRVLIMEPLGYGFSDGTKERRDLKHVSDELHDALHAYGVKKDYILLGHSASGLTIRQWICDYGDEVAGFIGEDMSVPAQFYEKTLSMLLADHGVMRTLFWVSRFFGLLGVHSLSAVRSKVLKEAAGEDKRLLRSYRAAFVHARLTGVLPNEYLCITSNGKTTEAQPMPECPALFLTANGKGSCESLTMKTDFGWVKAHHELAAQIPGSKCVELPGTHYLHYGFVDEMVKEIADYFQEK